MNNETAIQEKEFKFKPLIYCVTLRSLHFKTLEQRFVFAINDQQASDIIKNIMDTRDYEPVVFSSITLGNVMMNLNQILGSDDFRIAQDGAVVRSIDKELNDIFKNPLDKIIAKDLPPEAKDALKNQPPGKIEVVKDPPTATDQIMKAIIDTGDKEMLKKMKGVLSETNIEYLKKELKKKKKV